MVSRGTLVLCLSDEPMWPEWVMIESGKKRKCNCGKCVFAIQIDTSDAGWKLAEERRNKNDITEGMLDGFKRVIGHTYPPGLVYLFFSENFLKSTKNMNN